MAHSVSCADTEPPGGALVNDGRSLEHPCVGAAEGLWDGTTAEVEPSGGHYHALGAARGLLASSMQHRESPILVEDAEGRPRRPGGAITKDFTKSCVGNRQSGQRIPT